MHTQEETDLARAANEALHRLFDTTNADNRETLLAEVRACAYVLVISYRIVFRSALQHIALQLSSAYTPVQTSYLIIA